MGASLSMPTEAAMESEPLEYSHEAQAAIDEGEYEPVEFSHELRA